MSNLDYALKYAGIGLHVFPLPPGEKAAAMDFHKATTDAEQIKQWWSSTPSAGVGIYPFPGGWAVLDVDTKHGGRGPEQLEALEAEHGKLPDTLTARTPSGATHMVFRCSVPMGNHKIAPDIDVRCANGYIAVEPTRLHDGTGYAWLDWEVLDDYIPHVADLPQWVIDRSQQAAQQIASKGKVAKPAYTEPTDLDGLQARLQGFLAKAPKALRRWQGDKTGLQDTSGSAMDYSMVAILKRGGFDYSECVTLLSDWPHGSTGSQRAEPRYWQRIWERTSDPDPESGLPYASEMDLAETFTKENANRYRWSPGLDWLCNVGTHWEDDDTLTRYTLAKKVCKDAAVALSEEKMRYRVASASTVNNILTLARTEPGIATPIDAWDKEPMLLNTRGGVFDLKTGKRIEPDDLLFRQVTSVAPDAAMKTPVWDKFIADVFSEDLEVVDFIQRMSGYCLTGDTREQKLFFLHGTGSNGKNVFIDALHAIMGTYSHNLPSEALMSQRNEGHPTMYASLFGKRLAVSSEIEENAYWAEAKIKELTGNETLTARRMRQDFFEFKITHKHLLAGNYKPRLKGDDYAMVRRMVLIPFERTFQGANKDPLLPQKLRAEYPGILAWFIDGARKWAADGLHIPGKITAASEAYMGDNDDLAMWIDDCCITGKGREGRSKDLYTSFKAWKEAAGEKAQSERAFSQRLETKFQKLKDRNGRYFIGIDCRDFPAGPASYASLRG